MCNCKGRKAVRHCQEAPPSLAAGLLTSAWHTDARAHTRAHAHTPPPRPINASSQSRLGAARGGDKSQTALLRRALLLSPGHDFKLGHSYTSSHSRTVLSKLPDATCFPSGLKLTDFTI